MIAHSPVRLRQREATDVMVLQATTVAIAVALNVFVFVNADADKPCAARQIPGQSVVCVCNDAYCDEIVRQPPQDNQYVAYTSSEAGSRFKKSIGQMRSFHIWNETCSHTLELVPSVRHRTVEGFGGAVTDAVGIHFANLSETLKGHFVNSYFSERGLEYSMGRVPVGGCDFSTHDYAYNELPLDDKLLANFSLAPEDFQYKIPLLQRIMATAPAPVHLVGTVWSPPGWMKTNGRSTGPSAIKDEYFQTFADYYIKFVREYKKNGIDFWGITTTNEPTDSIFPFVKFQTLGWTPGAMGKWISQNLGPSIRNASDVKHLKILALDDQRFDIPLFNDMASKYPASLQYIDGVALHFYGDKITPAAVLELVSKLHPTKFLISTEACEGSAPWQKAVSLGDWSRAKSYITDIMTDLNYDMIGWIDWNMCLDEQGGPNWVMNFVDSPVIVRDQEFVKQPMFYALGHFSKWIPRGSVRIDVKETKGWLEASLENVAFVTPRNTVVLVVHNSGGARAVRVQLGDGHAVLPLEARSVVTVELAYSPNQQDTVPIDQ